MRRKKKQLETRLAEVEGLAARLEAMLLRLDLQLFGPFVGDDYRRSGAG